MAVSKIAFPVVYKQNTNELNKSFGKWFAEAYCPETLDLKGLINRVAFGQSVYSRDIVEGVIQKLTKDMVELLQSGQPVKWDGLGTFTPGVENTPGGAVSPLNANIDQLIAGVHINFRPENSKGEELTSRALKETITFEVQGVKVLNVTKDGNKTTRTATIYSMERYKEIVNGQNNGGDDNNDGD